MFMALATRPRERALNSDTKDDESHLLQEACTGSRILELELTK